MLAIKIRPQSVELHQKMVKRFDKSTKIWCSLGRIFCSQQISASFWCNIGQNFFRGNILLNFVILIEFIDSVQEYAKNCHKLISIACNNWKYFLQLPSKAVMEYIK